MVPLAITRTNARGRTRLTTVTSISCRSFQRQLLYLFRLISSITYYLRSFLSLSPSLDKTQGY